jgi:HAD superfamily hydrolase (TIGR01549 family)
MIQTIIFDFDGVIVESVSVKTDAFQKLFSFVPDHVDEIVQFHLKNGGMSRFDKFRYIYDTILHEDLSDEQFEKLSRRFSDLVEDAVAQAPFVDGARDFIDTMSDRYKLYIVSATPQVELRRIVNQKGISRYFMGVFGSPTKKIDHILRIVTENKVSPNDVLYVGDAVNDWEAARTARVKFIARIKHSELDKFSKLPNVECVISSINELKTYFGDHKC